MSAKGLSSEAIVLVGGLGTRLREALPDQQKVTAAVNGRPFLSRVIAWLEKSGVERIVLAAGHRADDVRSVVDAYAGNVEILVSIETRPLGTGGAVRLALGHTKGEGLLVLNGDSFADIDPWVLRDYHNAHRAKATLALVSVPDPDRYGTVEVDATGEVLSFREKQASATSACVNAGVYMFGRRTLFELPENEEISLERDVFPRLVGHGLYATLFEGAAFIDIGTPESLRAAARFFRGSQ